MTRREMTPTTLLSERMREWDYQQGNPDSSVVRAWATEAFGLELAIEIETDSEQGE